jgi:predicted Rossmann fold nucleotide-binding protein DprA/Smf involved in DNA uptake
VIPVLDDLEEKVWKSLSSHEPVSIDTLLARLPLSTSEVYSALLNLETKDYVRQLPGKKYVRRL